MATGEDRSRQRGVLMRNRHVTTEYVSMSGRSDRAGKLSPGKIRREEEWPDLSDRAFFLASELERIVLSGSADKVKELLSASEKAGVISPAVMNSSFHIALEGGDREKVDLLLSYGADPLLPKRQSGGPVYPVHSAALSGNLDLLELIISLGGDREAPDPEGDTPFLLFLQSGRGGPDEVRSLVRKGVDIHARNKSGKGALHAYAASGRKNPDVDVLEFLLQEGLDPNVTDDRGLTPLHTAVCSFKGKELVDIAEILLSYGADVNAGALCGQSVLFEAIKCDRRELVSFLVGNGADLNGREGSPISPLHLAAREGREKIVEILVAKGADGNRKDRNGRTPLHYAAFFDSPEIMRLLLSERSTVPETEDSQGKTFLYFVKSPAVRKELSLLLSERHRRESLENIKEKEINVDWDLYDR